MVIGGAIHFILLAAVTLPLAGVPLAIWMYVDFRRNTNCESRDHKLSSVVRS